jgi:hypothetical protein
MDFLGIEQPIDPGHEITQESGFVHHLNEYIPKSDFDLMKNDLNTHCKPPSSRGGGFYDPASRGHSHTYPTRDGSASRSANIFVESDQVRWFFGLGCILGNRLFADFGFDPGNFREFSVNLLADFFHNFWVHDSILIVPHNAVGGA